MGTIHFKGNRLLQETEGLREEPVLTAELKLPARKFRMFEEVGKRDEFTKHYRMSDGSYRAEVFDEMVHYYDETQGKYIAVDNTLQFEPRQGEGDFDGYRVRQNYFQVKLSSDLQSGNVARVSKGEHEILWRIAGTNAAAELAACPEAGEETAPVSSGICYRNAFPETDLNYDIIGNRVKENIVIKGRGESYDYDFELGVRNLNVKLGEENQSLIFCVNEILDDGSMRDKEVFLIPAPYMSDANGADCGDVYYELEQLSDNRYRFRVSASKEWIDLPERAFPVTVDPMIIVNKDYSSLRTKTVYQQSSTTGTESGVSYRTIGRTSDGRVNRMYVQFSMPTIDDDSYILSAQMYLKNYSSSSYKGLEVRKVLKSFSASTMTWNTQSSSGFYDTGRILDYIETGDSTEANDYKYSIDLTEYVEDVKRNGAVNYGIVVKSIDESAYGYIKVYSENASSVNNQPMLVIDYRSAKGADESQSFQKNDVKRAGQSMVNLCTGNLTFVHRDIALEGNKMPTNIAHIYNGYMAGKNYDYNVYSPIGFPLNVGYGWRLNLQQLLVKAPYGSGTNANYRSERYIYIDGNGREHYLVESGETDTCVKTFVDDSGLGLTLNENTRVIRDSEKNELHFNSDGTLKKIVNQYGVSQTLYYNGTRITQIVDGAGRSTRLIYDNNCCLSQIIAPDNKITYYRYSGGLLTKIEYPDETFTTFTYEGNRLKTVKDKSGYQLTYTYSGDKVTKVEESCAYSKITNDSQTMGNSTRDCVEIIYMSLRMTVVMNRKNVKVSYIFNEKGETVAMYEDAIVGTTSTTHAVGEIAYSGKDPDRVVNANISQSAASFVKNGGFGTRDASSTAKPANWSGYRNDTSATVGSYTSYLHAEGAEAYAITGEKGVTKRLEQSVDMTAFKAQEGYAKNVYVLSGWAKADSVAIKDDYGSYTADRKFEVRAEVSYSDGESKIYRAKFDTRNRDWQIAATAFAIEETAARTLSGIRIAVEYSDNANTAYFDNIRLIKGAASITETKLIDRDGADKLYDFEDIEKVTYASCGYCCNYVSNRYGYVTKRDMQLMIDDYENNYYSFAIRMNNGKLVLPYARSVSFGMKDGSSVPLWAVRLKTITRTNNGKMETESDPLDGGKKIISYIFNANGERFDTEKRFNDKHQLIYSKDYRGLVQENEYDAWGNLTQSITYPYDEGKNTVNRLVTKNTYQNGDFIKTETDSRYHDTDQSELLTQYDYSSTTGRLSDMTTANGHITYYGYDGDNGNITSVYSNVDGKQNMNSYSYRLDYLTELTHNGFSYRFEYDGFGNITRAMLDDTSLLTKTYTFTSGNDTEIINYANGYSVKKEYDKYGSLVKTYENNVLKVENKYLETDGTSNSSTKLSEQIDNYSNMRYNYTYDPDGEIQGVSFTGTHTGSIVFDRDIVNERVNGVTYQLDGETLNYVYNYDKRGDAIYPDNQVESVTLSNGFESCVTRDKLGRADTKTISQNNLTIEDQYTYQKGGYYDVCNRFVLDRTTPFVSKVTQTVGNAATQTSYTYDKNGNIKTITTPRGNVQYSYDKLNRLTMEDNGILRKVCTYTYDAGGNILQKKITEKADGNVTTIPYAYGNAWKDQLTSWNGQSITYDGMGNPLSYLGAMLTWTRGRLLNSYAKGSTTASFAYNADGLRTQKSAGGVTHKYLLEGSKILREDRVSSAGTDSLIYYYDMNGAVGFGLKKQGESAYTKYYYAKNLQGDVTAIYNVFGQKVAAYEYDAWGNQTITTNVNGIAALNPFRYRSYYFDDETSLYYLNSRYYDSKVGRFLNADVLDSLGNILTTINGINLYAYCVNNPVMDRDEDGDWPKWLKAVVCAVAVAVVAVAVTVAVVASGGTALIAGTVAVGAVTSGAGNIVDQGLKKGWDNIDFTEAAIETLSGAAYGLAVATTAGGAAMAAKAGISALTSMAHSSYAGGSGLDIVVSGVKGGAVSLAGQLAGKGAGKVGNKIMTRIGGAKYLEKVGEKQSLRDLNKLMGIKKVPEPMDLVKTAGIKAAACVAKYIWNNAGKGLVEGILNGIFG